MVFRSHCTLIIWHIMLCISSLLTISYHICIMPLSLSNLHVCHFCTTFKHTENSNGNKDEHATYCCDIFLSNQDLQGTEFWVLQIPPFLIYLEQKPTDSYAYQLTVQRWVSHLTFQCLKFFICQMPMIMNTCPTELAWVSNEIMECKMLCKSSSAVQVQCFHNNNHHNLLKTYVAFVSVAAFFALEKLEFSCSLAL